MLNREEFNRALRLSMAILVLSLMILGGLWINYLYSRFNLEIEAYQLEAERTIEQSIQEKVQILVQQADRLYADELADLKERMVNRMGVIKSNLFEYDDLNHDVLEGRVTQDGENFFKRTGISQSINSEKLNLAIGNQTWIGSFRTRSFNEQGDWLIYSDYSAASRAVIQLRINKREHLQAQLADWIKNYHELDKRVILLEGADQSVFQSGAFGHDNYFALATSELSGFTLGYFTPRAELAMMLDERRLQFTRFLDNHLIEIAAFLSLFGITLAVFFHLTAGQYNRQIGALNDEIISQYRKPKEEFGELYREYGLSRSIDTVVADAQRKQDYIDMLKLKHDKEMKLARIEFLQLQRRYEFMLDKTKVPMATQFTPLREEINVHDLIEEAHLEHDPSKLLRLIGDEQTIQSDRTFLQTLIETYFRLSRDDKRKYQVEYLVDQGFIKLFLTLEDVTVLDSEGIERIKYLAEMLGGSVMRLYQGEENFSLVLRLSAE